MKMNELFVTNVRAQLYKVCYTMMLSQEPKNEQPMQLWTRESNAGSENTDEQSHSPSVDSGSSAIDGETNDKEQQVTVFNGIIIAPSPCHGFIVS